MTCYQAVGTVIDMAGRKKSGTAEKRAVRVFPAGPDGKTANQRLRDVLTNHPLIRTEAQLIRECNRLAQTSPGDEDYVGQRSINNFLNDVDSLENSKYVSVIAEALGIRAFWLQTGKGVQVDQTSALMTQLRNLVQGHGHKP